MALTGLHIYVLVVSNHAGKGSIGENRNNLRVSREKSLRAQTRESNQMGFEFQVCKGGHSTSGNLFLHL